MEFNKQITVAMDCDEVLTNISPLWTKLIYDNREYFDKYFDLKESFDINSTKDYVGILMRDTFELNKYFIKPEFNIEEETELNERFFALYNNPYFYKACQPTKIANAIATILDSKYINKLYVISSSFDKTIDSKKEFIHKLFKRAINKVEFIPIEKGQLKSKVINDLNNIDVYFDDEPKHIYDVLSNADSKREMDIYIPELGYNFPAEDAMNELRSLSKENNKNIIYYQAL